MTDNPANLTCPVPDSGEGETITLAHGEGGRLMRRLIRQRLLPAVDNEFLGCLGDARAVARGAGTAGDDHR